MSCGGRVYKGDSVTISVPFDVEGYSNLVITYSTIGDAVIEKTQEEVTIEDGFITYTFDGHELDILPDGVIYYTISYQIDGVEHVESTNTPIYLATPAGYSGLTADEIYQSGYTAGLNDCSGDTPCDCTSAVTQAYQSGYTAGYESGYEDGEEDCPSLQYQKNVTIGAINGTIVPDSHYDAMRRVSFNAQLVYNSGYQSGYSAGQADCSGTTDCSSAITEAYESGYTAGLNDCSGGSSCEVGYTWYDLMDGEFNGEVTLTLPDFNLPVGQIGVSSITIADKDYGEGKYNSGYNSGFTDGYASAITASSGSCLIQAQKTYSLDPAGDGTWTAHPDGGYDGVAEIVIKDNVGYGQSLYTSGYAAGLAACSGGCNLIADTNSLNGAWGGRTTYYPPAGYDGFSEMTIYDNGYGNSRYNDGRTAGFNSGYTSGYTDGYSSGFTDGHTSGYTEGYEDGVIDSCTGCQAAIDNAYESGITDGQGSIFSVEVVFTETNNSWTFEALYNPDVLIIDENGNSHQLVYQFSETPDLYRYNHYTDTGTGNTGYTITLQFAGYLQDGAKYIQPYEVRIPMSNTNLFSNNLDGVSVKINGEVIHNWHTGIYGYMLDDWQFGGGAWSFTPIATVVSDTYYDNDHRLVTFYLQGEGPMPA